MRPGLPIRRSALSGTLAFPVGTRSLLIALAVLGIASRPAVAQEALSSAAETVRGSDSHFAEPRDRSVPIVVHRIEGPFEFDGEREKPVWDAIQPLPSVMHLPDFGAAPTERTEFRLAHDGQYIYFSCRAYDSHPELIQIASLRRDERGWISDRCAIYLDTLNDGENSVGFIATPGGAQTDVTYTNGSRPNFDWDAFWDLKTVRDDQGWHAEFRIPLSSLLLQPDETGRTVMGVSMLRGVARRDERQVFPAIPPRWGNLSHAKSSEMQKIALEGVNLRRPLQITPYTLAGGGYTHVVNAVGDAYDRQGDPVREMGLDVKYGLTSNLTLDVTLNTDFAQVEADEQQTNLTRFSLFFPEKRRFFQDRSAIFDYSLGGNERLFHSRRVGLAQGEPVRIFGGARVVGRAGEWDIGMLNMQTAESASLPSENQGVVRLRRRVINEASYVGGLVTSRVGTDGTYNVVAGADGIFQLFEQDYVTLSMAQSFDDKEATASGRIGLLDRSLLRLNWDRPVEDGLFYGVDLTRAGEVFEPRMGFLQRRDYTKAETRLGHGWWPEAGTSPLRNYMLAVGSTVFRRNADETIETVEVVPEAMLVTRGTHTLLLSAPLRYEDLAEGFELSDEASVPAGLYRFGGLRLTYRSPQGIKVQTPVTAEIGDFFDGTQKSLSIRPSWSVSKNLSLGTGYSVDRVDFPTREQSFTAHVGQLRTEVMLSNAISILSFLQYSSADEAMVGNFRFHYRPREGNDLYLVWNEGLVTDRLRDRDLVRPFSDRRTLLIKYSHTFRVGL